jgi:hypothetical protein
MTRARPTETPLQNARSEPAEARRRKGSVAVAKNNTPGRVVWGRRGTMETMMDDTPFFAYQSIDSSHERTVLLSKT